MLVKIHLHNVKLLKELQPIESAVRRGIMLYQKVYQSMPHLADYINRHKRKDEIKGVVGITMLHKGAARLGFDVIKPSSGCYRLFKKAAIFRFYTLLQNSSPSKTFLTPVIYLFPKKN